ncbi:hypothetical protein PCYB_001910 [Plasmodium cynomolgi strain B]|uniref:CYIR protein n=1 Tax=Plasmodium cynomolgi (strain B) TaxID=1120755 RepID=K6UNF6_PLACD|nr:hypothetical protein PCYB_001910 [Plasmodium cynomolgi strain B]GAB69443.1 hypothetical protein PCYB_001910 [Plasmodium cynomolgi strain B]
MFEDNVQNADCTLKRSIESELQNHIYFGKHKKGIEKAWCRALTMRKDDSALYSERCTFLYYWIGSKVKGAFNSSMFPTMTNVLYKYLQTYGFSGECTNICTNISEDLFTWGKKIFDYSHNHNTIE